MVKRPVAPRRQVRRTVLIVGEGLAEASLLKHLRSLYTRALQVTIKNAKGKGGRHVLSHALSERLRADYDDLGCLLDTDAAWDDVQRRKACRERVEVFECHPCIEALLLRIVGLPPPDTSRACKQAFQQHFGAPAHEERLYARHFSLDVLERARAQVEVLDRLLRYLSR